jgi:hypothetical protein
MTILKISGKLLLITALLFMGGCEIEQKIDPCQRTKWSLPKEYEIKLAVHISSANSSLPGGTAGSQYPADFQSMLVNGTIEFEDCSGDTDGPHNLGNTYLTKEIDYPAPVDVPQSYWIGHVVYVYTFDNDNDRIYIDLNVKVTMPDSQSYVCTFSEEVTAEQINQVPGEMYHYILLDVYSDLWVKV